MTGRTDASVRTTLAMNLEFTRGRHGAAARLELFDGPDARTAVFALRGWIDAAAARRVEQTIDDLLGRDVRRLIVDGSRLQHVDYRQVPRIGAAFARFEARAGAVTFCGLSRYLLDLFRLSGCDGPLRDAGAGPRAWEVAVGAAPAGERAS